MDTDETLTGERNDTATPQVLLNADETSEVGAQSGPTQTNPTFSRADLGAANFCKRNRTVGRVKWDIAYT